MIQLEFSLLALHDDPLPLLHRQLQTLQQSGNSAAAAEIDQQLANENAKRERWAVSFDPLHSLSFHHHFLIFGFLASYLSIQSVCPPFLAGRLLLPLHGHYHADNIIPQLSLFTPLTLSSDVDPSPFLH